MNETEVIKITLNNTLSRVSKIVQDYEVEIANLTVEFLKLQIENEGLKKEVENQSNIIENFHIQVLDNSGKTNVETVPASMTEVSEEHSDARGQATRGTRRKKSVNS